MPPVERLDRARSGRGGAGTGRLLRFLLPVLAVLFVLVPFLFWRGTWFGRRLDDGELVRYLADTEHPRQVQHALSQIADRIVAGESAIERFYPQVRALVHHDAREVRMTVAWVLGQDPRNEEARHALSDLLDDPEPLVRRNAALSLVRFGDERDRGHAEIVAMLHPYTVLSPAAGRVRLRLETGSPVNPGTLLARVEPSDRAAAVEVRSPVSGEVRDWLVEDGSEVAQDDPLFRIEPSDQEVWEALRALYLVGRTEDLEDVERYAKGGITVSEEVRRQASLTADAIRRRSG